MEEKKKTKELSYEELKNVAGQLQQQNTQLRQALQRVNYENLFRRLDYLFKVIENSAVFSEEFVVSCVEEIEDSIKVPEESDTKVEE